MKRIGILVVAVAALLASVGSGSSAAATLCDMPIGGCALPGTPYEASTILNGSLVPLAVAEFQTSSYGTIKCTVGALEVKTTAGVFEAEITVLKFSSCTPCAAVTALALPWKSTSFTAFGGGNGRMQSVGTFLNFEASGCNVKGQPTTCKFGSEAIRFEVTGGSPAIFEGGAGVGFEPNPCGASEWTAKFKIGTPQPLYVV